MHPVWQAAESAVMRGDDEALARLLREHEQLFREHAPPPYTPQGPAPEYDPKAHAREIIAREHYFETWEQFESRQKDSPFERAVEAIIRGDEETMRVLLDEDKDLVRARSTRRHHATLLHYVGANGVEGFRQKTPKNAVEIAKMLIEAGAEVDATAEMYGGDDTTLGLVATSIHPELAGVQSELIEFLIDRGAKTDAEMVNACLANGRPKAARLLARRGATLDLEGAAGIGWLDAVKELEHAATPDQVKSGFQWACEYGHTAVVEYLLTKEVDVGEVHRGQTGLHWAAFGGHADIVRLLLGHNAPVDIRDERWNATPLGWAEYGKHEKVIEMLKRAGAS